MLGTYREIDGGLCVCVCVWMARVEKAQNPGTGLNGLALLTATWQVMVIKAANGTSHVVGG